MSSLHTKYRPAQLSELVGQPFIKRALTGALTNNRIAPAYLFTGSRGTGKTSTARILAKSLNCTDGVSATPCLQCPSCQSIQANTNLELVEIDAASNSGVEDARNLRQQLYLSHQSRYKVVIIDECHMLSNSAQNALLKILEEPPHNTVIIFCTTESHKVLSTIKSRCQEFIFAPAPQSELVGLLRSICDQESIQISDDALQVITQSVSGGLRDAQTLLGVLHNLDHVDVSDVYESLGSVSPIRLLPVVSAIQQNHPKNTLKAVQSVLMQGSDIKALLDCLVTLFRDLYAASVADDDALLSSTPDVIAQLRKLNPITASIQPRLKRLTQASIEFQTVAQSQLTTWFEVLCLDLALLARHTEASVAQTVIQATTKPVKSDVPQSSVVQPVIRSDGFDANKVYSALSRSLQLKVPVECIKSDHLQMPSKEGADLLRRHMSKIYKAYEDAGYRLDQLDVHVG